MFTVGQSVKVFTSTGQWKGPRKGTIEKIAEDKQSASVRVSTAPTRPPLHPADERPSGPSVVSAELRYNPGFGKGKFEYWVECFGANEALEEFDMRAGVLEMSMDQVLGRLGRAEAQMSQMGLQISSLTSQVNTLKGAASTARAPAMSKPAVGSPATSKPAAAGGTSAPVTPPPPNSPGS